MSDRLTLAAEQQQQADAIWAEWEADEAQRPEREIARARADAIAAFLAGEFPDCHVEVTERWDSTYLAQIEIPFQRGIRRPLR